MGSFSIQFHATPDELTDFVSQWASMDGVHCAAVWYQPYSVFEVEPTGVVDAVERGARRFVFGENVLCTEVSGNNELLDKNPGLLILEVGQLSELGLGESHLSTTEAGVVWKAIARSLRRATKAGATAVNETTGAAAPARTHRFTKGAQELCRAGTRMRTPGLAVMRFEQS